MDSREGQQVKSREKEKIKNYLKFALIGNLSMKNYRISLSLLIKKIEELVIRKGQTQRRRLR